jgi:hypothetical protein
MFLSKWNKAVQRQIYDPTVPLEVCQPIAQRLYPSAPFTDDGRFRDSRLRLKDLRTFQTYTQP